jgi:hypothetical protein
MDEKMKVGDLVIMKGVYAIPGVVMKVEEDLYGRDMLMVLWPNEGFTYEEPGDLKQISEGPPSIELTDDELENVCGGMDDTRFEKWKYELLQ